MFNYAKSSVQGLLLVMFFSGLVGSSITTTSPLIGAAVVLAEDGSAGDNSDAEEKGDSAAKEPKKKDKLPQSGVISSTGDMGYGSANVGGVWGGVDAQGTEAAPVTGSVMTGADSHSWLAKVFNNSADTYSANFEVVQMDKSGKRIKGDFFSATLRGKASVERTFRKSSNVASAQLKINGWKNLSEKKTEKKAEEDAQKGAVEKRVEEEVPGTTAVVDPGEAEGVSITRESRGNEE